MVIASLVGVGGVLLQKESYPCVRQYAEIIIKISSLAHHTQYEYRNFNGGRGGGGSKVIKGVSSH